MKYTITGARGNVIYPVGDQVMSFISRKDSAEAIANVAVRPYLRDKEQIYLLTQEKNYNMVELSRITGRTPQNMKDFLAENYKK